MKWRLVGLGVLLAVGVAIGTIALTRSARFSIVDEDCSDDVRYGVAVTVPGPGIDQGYSDVALVDRDGRVTRLTRDRHSLDPTFSPDGTRLAFTRGHGFWDDTSGLWENQDIVMSEMDGTNVENVTDGPHLDIDPAWSPDGDVIAFARHQAGLMLVSASGGKPRILVPDERINIYPSSSVYDWSPDGDRIAFAAGGPEAGIYVINEDGTGLHRIASHLGSIDALAWSPDGETFAYGGGGGIFTVTFEERNPRLWRRGELEEPEFSPDGTQLLYLDRGSTDDPMRYLVAPLEAGTPEPLAENRVPAAFMRNMDWLDCS